MENDVLNYWLSKFIVEVRKENLEEYPPNSLLSMLMGLQGYLRLQGRTVDFLNDPEYDRIKQVLDAEMKRLTAKGTGSNTRKAEALTDKEIEKLWQTKQLGDFNPGVLIRTVLFLNGINFGMRGGQEHRNLRYNPPQITLHKDGKVPYLKYREDCSKTIQGGLKHRRITKKEVIHHANLQCPERCHVRLYERYMELSPTTGTLALKYK